VALNVVCQDRNDASWSETLAVLRAALRFGDPPLRGIAWFLSELRFADAFRWQSAGFGTVVDEAAWRRLLERCWAARTGEERGGAAFLLSGLCHWHPSQIAALGERTTLLSQWVEEVTEESAGGLGRLLNDVAQTEGGRDVVRAICAATDPHRIAAWLNAVTWSQAWSQGWLLGRIGYNATPAWRERLREDLDIAALQTLFSSAADAELGSLSELVEGIAEIDYELSLSLLDLAAPAIGGALSRSPVEGWKAAGQLILFFLRFYSPGLGIPPPTRQQRPIGKRIARAVDPVAVASDLSGSRRRDWPVYHELLIFLKSTMPTCAREVIDRVDLAALDRTIGGMWSGMPDELLRLVWAMFVAEGRGPGRVSEWVSSHAEEFTGVTPHLVQIAPTAAAVALRKGHRLHLDVGKGWGWNSALLAMVELENVDRQLAVKVLEDNQNDIAKGFASLREYDSIGVPYVLQILHKLVPKLVPTILDKIDPAIAEAHWAKRLQGKADERGAAAALIEAAFEGSDELAALATRLRRRFPRASTIPAPKA